MSPTRRYFTKAQPSEPAKLERSPAWDETFVSGFLPSGNHRRYKSAWLRRMLGRSKGGKACHAKGRAKSRFTSETARKAIRKRWVGTARKPGRNRLGPRGIRIGLRNPKPRLNYAELRIRYAILRDGWRVRYDTAAKQWFVRDDLGERRCSERIALQYAGHIARPSTIGRLPKTFKGIDLQKEGWNRD